MINVFNYTDYRKFLKDRFAYLKKEDKKFTYRYIAEQTGFKSAGYITQILQEKSKLSDRLVPKLAETILLKKRETRYFELMVNYNQAKFHNDKKEIFEKMLAFKKSRLSIIEPEEYEFYERWYYSAIRALIKITPFDGDYQRISKVLVPNISISETKKALKVLEKLEYIKQDSSGIYNTTDKHVQTDFSSNSVAINNFVLNTFDIAKDALYNFSHDERVFSSLTINVSQHGFDRIKEKVAQFRNELMTIVENDHNSDRVCQANFQLFPLSDPLQSDDFNQAN